MSPSRLERPAAGGSSFQRIWEVVASIPRGRVATYGQIARMAGLEGGARTVGWALRALPDGSRIAGRRVPWQRVVNARGAISARSSGPDGPETRRQALLLRREGIPVRAGSHIDLARYAWRGGRRVSPPRGRTR